MMSSLMIMYDDDDDGVYHIVGAPLIEEFSSLIRARITVFSRELSF